MKNYNINITNLIYIMLSMVLFSCSQKGKEAISSTPIPRIEGMPNMPEPYQMLNWKEKSINFDRYLFTREAEGEYIPLIWFDSARRNVDQVTFGLYTAIGDVRQGRDKNNGEFHEAINSLGALLSAGLVGIDKTDQEGINYVKMVQNYFNSDNSWNIMMNNTSAKIAMLGGGYGRDWWYDVFPNVLYYALCEVFPETEGAEEIQRTIAEQFYKADSVLAGNYDYSYFDYAKMKGVNNHIVAQQDAAAGHAYVLYLAYKKFGDDRYLDGAKSAIEALLTQKESRFYEVLMPFGALVAAKLNAEEGTNFDVTKIINWTFEGCKVDNGRKGWGIISDRWGDFDVHGLQGSIIQEGGYAFLMNTFDMAWPLVPLVKYDPRYSRAIGKWMLNAANSARLFYPFEIPDKNQWLPDQKSVTKNLIGYEGLKKKDIYDKENLKGVSPVALGDGPNWVDGQPEVSMFSIYGSAHVGIFGSIIEKTNIEGILRLDCNATDFRGQNQYPTYLYYNPYMDNKEVIYTSKGVDKFRLFDVINGQLLPETEAKDARISIAGDQAMLIIELPASVADDIVSARIEAKDQLNDYYQRFLNK